MNRPIPDQVILGLLKAQPAHGYDLLACFRSKASLGWIWTISTSQLYAVLKRLEKAGAITGTEISTMNAPTRTVYAITALGEEQLFAWLYDSRPSASIHRIRVIFLSRIFIANILGEPVCDIVDAQITSCSAQKKAFLERKQHSSSAFETLALDFVIRQLNSVIQWLTEGSFEVNIDPLFVFREVD